MVIQGVPWNTGQTGHASRGRDREVVPWDGKQVEPGAEPTRAEVIGRYDTNDGSGGRPPGRRQRSLLITLLALLVVAILAIVVLVITRPTKGNQALDKPSATASPSASPSATSPSPSPSGSAAAPTDSTTASPAATGTDSQPGTAQSTVQADGGGAGAEVADLSALNPVQTGDISGPSTGPEQIGATIYQNSVGFTCYSDHSYIDYNVAGYKFLNTVIGIPSNASNAAGNSMTVTFFKDGSSTQLGSPVTVSLDHPQSVHLNLDGSSQLEIACMAIDQTSHSRVSMDGALGNATIGPS